MFINKIRSEIMPDRRTLIFLASIFQVSPLSRDVYIFHVKWFLYHS